MTNQGRAWCSSQAQVWPALFALRSSCRKIPKQVIISFVVTVPAMHYLTENEVETFWHVIHALYFIHQRNNYLMARERPN